MTHDGPTGDGPAPAEPPATPSPQPESAAVPTAEPEPVAESAAVPTDPAVPTPEPADVPGFAPAVVPPKRRLGLVLGLVGGAVALVLLLCAVLVPLALHSATTTRAGAATAASPTPSPSSTPLSDSEYQQTLDTIDNRLKVSVNGLRDARGPDSTMSLGTVLGDAIHEAAGTLDGITSPDRAELANRGLVSALGQLADPSVLMDTEGLLAALFNALEDPLYVRLSLWAMAAHREKEDRKYGVVNVQPEFGQSGSGLEAARR